GDKLELVVLARAIEIERRIGLWAVRTVEVLELPLGVRQARYCRSRAGLGGVGAFVASDCHSRNHVVIRRPARQTGIRVVGGRYPADHIRVRSAVAQRPFDVIASDRGYSG